MRPTSFYFSFLALPAPKRRAITAVWDFCHAVDDGVDLERDPERVRTAVDHWRAEVGRVFSSETPLTTEGARLQPFVGPAHLPRVQFEALVDGVEMDALPREYSTFADLEPYCHRVASAVGLICAEIFEYDDPAVLDYARDLGVALQLTNILRDVGVDYRQGRRYIPLEDLSRFGCSWTDVGREVDAAGSGVRSPQVRAVLEQQAARARVFYSRALRALPKTEARRFVPAEIMRAVYSELLRRIERADFDVFSRVVRVPRPRQVGIAARTWWRTR